MEVDAKKCELWPITIFGRQGLFYSARIERLSLPKGWHMYEIMHHKENPNQPVQIGKLTLCNFYGTVLTTKAIELPEQEWGYREMDEESDLCFLKGKAVTLKEYEKQRHRTHHRK